MTETKTTVVTSATGEPVSLSEIKNHLRITTTTTNDADSLVLLNLIVSARIRTEEITNRKLMPQKLRLYKNSFPNTDRLEIPYPPLRSVPTTGILYTDSSGSSTTLSTGNYDIDTVSEPGAIVLKSTGDWPSDTLYTNNPVQVDFNCGYSTKSAVPESYKLAISLIVGHWFENRENSIVGHGINEIPICAKSILYPYRQWDFG